MYSTSESRNSTKSWHFYSSQDKKEEEKEGSIDERERKENKRKKGENYYLFLYVRTTSRAFHTLTNMNHTLGND